MKPRKVPARITVGKLIKLLENASSWDEVIIEVSGTQIEFRVWEQWHDSSESKVRIDLVEVPAGHSEEEE